MGNFAQMSYMLGVFTGAVVLGSLADKYADILKIIYLLLAKVKIFNLIRTL